METWSGECRSIGVAAAIAALATVTGAPLSAQAQPAVERAARPPTEAQVARGRHLVLNHGCGDCHGGTPDPTAEGFLAGYRPDVVPPLEFLVGACAVKPDATPCFRTRPRNLTPDNATGLGRFSERQIFNAMRYGLRPGETPDVMITGSTPGQGNFPASPKYLAPPMPWPAFRHMTDQELLDIAAYLKHGVGPVSNRVPDSEGPPDFWASEYTVARIGPHPAAAFPTARERRPEVMRAVRGTGGRSAP
jgi:mono/diheme cytochrome c family protein